MKKFKDYLLITLVILSQVHTIFKGSGLNLVWLINGVSKSLNFSVFLLIKHVTVFILYCLLLKPKGINKNLLLMLLIVSFLDVTFFIINSNYQVNLIKFVIAALIFFAFKSKFNKWARY